MRSKCIHPVAGSNDISRCGLGQPDVHEFAQRRGGDETVQAEAKRMGTCASQISARHQLTFLNTKKDKFTVDLRLQERKGVGP